MDRRKITNGQVYDMQQALQAKVNAMTDMCSAVSADHQDIRKDMTAAIADIHKRLTSLNELYDDIGTLYERVNRNFYVLCGFSIAIGIDVLLRYVG